MQIPSKVSNAINLIWATIALSVLASLGNVWIGDISQGEFMLAVLFYSLFCIFPYKFARRSNPSRWVYAVLIGISILMWLGGVVTDMPKLDLIVSIVITPIEIYILFCLFQGESNDWFSTPANNT
jgi:uncharacterized membrane protein YccC